MKKSILDVIKEEVLNDCGYAFSIKEDIYECTISIHFDTKVIYQSLFERLLKITPLLERDGFHWQVYVDVNGNLSIMLF